MADGDAAWVPPPSLATGEGDHAKHVGGGESKSAASVTRPLHPLWRSPSPAERGGGTPTLAPGYSETGVDSFTGTRNSPLMMAASLSLTICITSAGSLVSKSWSGASFAPPFAMKENVPKSCAV